MRSATYIAPGKLPDIISLTEFSYNGVMEKMNVQPIDFELNGRTWGKPLDIQHRVDSSGATIITFSDRKGELHHFIGTWKDFCRDHYKR